MSTILTRKDIVDQLLSEQNDVAFDNLMNDEEKEYWINRLNKRIELEREKLFNSTDQELIRSYNKQLGRISLFAPGLFSIKNEYENISNTSLRYNNQIS